MENPNPQDNVLVGAEAIEAYLAEIGFPNENAYYLHRTKRWPIGKYGKYLIATKANDRIGCPVLFMWISLFVGVQGQLRADVRAT